MIFLHSFAPELRMHVFSPTCISQVLPTLSSLTFPPKQYLVRSTIMKTINEHKTNAYFLPVYFTIYIMWQCTIHISHFHWYRTVTTANKMWNQYCKSSLSFLLQKNETSVFLLKHQATKNRKHDQSLRSINFGLGNQKSLKSVLVSKEDCLTCITVCFVEKCRKVGGLHSH